MSIYVLGAHTVAMGKRGKIDWIYVMGALFLLALLAADVALFLGYDDWLPRKIEAQQ